MVCSAMWREVVSLPPTMVSSPSEAVRTCASCTSTPEHTSMAREARTSSLTPMAMRVKRGLGPALIGTVSRNSSQSCRKAALPPG